MNSKIWIEQCDATKHIEDEFGTDKALAYLIGDKFLNYLEAADTNETWRSEIPAFVERIRTIFEPWQLADYFDQAKKVEAFNPLLYDEEEDDIIEMERQFDLSRSAAHILLVERAKQWLFDEG